MNKYKKSELWLVVIIVLVCTGLAAAETTYLFERLWPTLAQPWYFNSPAGLARDGSGNLLIADSFNGRVQKFTAQGHFITMWNGGSGGADFEMPQDVAVDLDGNIYVVDSQACTVRVFNPMGAEIASWGSAGAGIGQFTGPQGVAVDTLGRVYVADTGNNRIQIFDGAGTPLGLLGESAVPPIAWSAPHDLAFDTSGNIYVADTGNDRIVVLDAEGLLLRETGGPGSGPGLFNYPVRVLLDSTGNLYVTDQMNYRIQKFDSTGAYLLHWGGEGDSIDEFSVPDGLALDNFGHILVADRGFHDRIQVFTDAGTFVAAWGSQWGGHNEFDGPTDVAADTEGNIYVTDHGNHRIQKSDQNGLFVGLWGPATGEPGHCEAPYALALNPDNDLAYVYDMKDGKIRQYNMAGTFLNEWDSGAGATIYAGLASAGDYLYVADSLHCRVRTFSHSGEPEEPWGEMGSEEGQLLFPYDVAVGNTSELYVADTYNHRIQVFDGEGTFKRGWGSQGSGPGEFNMPVSVAVAQDGSVLVTDSDNHRVQQFSPDGDFIAQFGTFGGAPGQLNGPGGVASVGADRVVVADTLNNRMQLFRAVETATQAKAIIVAGGGPIAGNALWDATRLCAHFAYHTLRYSGYPKENLYLLSDDQNVDLDNDGLANDVNDACTLSALQYALTEWVDAADLLVVYLVNHGGVNTFRMNGAEILEASVFSQWLSTAREHVSGPLVVVNDSCHSGSFITALSETEMAPAPIVVASAEPAQSAYFLGTGSLSFSSLFWMEILNGLDVGTAFEFADATVRGIYTLQSPQLDGNGDGTANAPDDFLAAGQVFLSMASGGSDARPVINTVETPMAVTGNAPVEIIAKDIESRETLAQVWAVVRPPDIGAADGAPPILSLPIVSLDPVEGIGYRGAYEDLSAPGEYQFSVYARDVAGRTSEPVLRTVSASDALRSRAVIVAAAAPDSPLWETARTNAFLAYQALRFQGYTEEDIQFYCAETFTAGVDGTPTVSNLQYALGPWATAGTRDLILYLVGTGAYGMVELAPEEAVFGDTLKTWLDALQPTMPGPIVVVSDFCNAGSFLPALAGIPDGQRIVISGCGVESAPSFADEGEISFSRFFWRQVLAGSNLRAAFLRAANALHFADAANAPHLDDTGDGLYSPGLDGVNAATITLGRGIQAASDKPMLLDVCPPQTIGGKQSGDETTAELRVNTITSTAPIEEVFAVVFPPDHDPWDCGAAYPGGYVLSLVEDETGGYYVLHDGFRVRGRYPVRIYAVDVNGEVSAPVETEVNQLSPTVDPDAYEPDDTPESASWIGLGGTAQRHNFDRTEDEDWALFFAEENQVIVLETRHLGPAADTQLALYRAGETPELIAEDDDSNPAELRASFIQWQADADGFYLAQAVNLPPGIYGADAYYDLIVRDETGLTIPGTLAVVVENDARLALDGATVSLPGFGALSGTTDSQGTALFSSLPARPYTVQAAREGYHPASQSVSVNAGQTATVTLILQQVSEGEEEGEGEVPLPTVPDLTGHTEEEAAAMLTTAGLALGEVSEQYHDTVSLGLIISQSPAAGAEVALGTTVAITVSLGKEPEPSVQVPDVTGRTRAEAEATLTTAGLVLGTVSEQYHDTVAPGQVISQSPVGGAEVPPGTAVAITVSLGKEPENTVAVPNIAGQHLGEAAITLAASGLVLGTLNEAYHDTVSVGRVISQTPLAGAAVSSGTAVAITLSLGKEPEPSVTVPDILGMTREEAEAALVAAGLLLGAVSEQYHPTIAAGLIISQTPQAGAQVPPQSGVSITISLGMEPEPLTLQEVAELLLENFATADTNGDNQLDFTEAHQVAPAITNEQFAQLDINRDGFIAEAELEEALQENRCGGCSGNDAKTMDVHGLLEHWLLFGLSLVLLCVLSQRQRP